MRTCDNQNRGRNDFVKQNWLHSRMFREWTNQFKFSGRIIECTEKHLSIKLNEIKNVKAQIRKNGNNQVILEKLFDATIERVWEAITNKDEMKSWYFDFEDFQPVVGFQFQFYGGHEEGIQYLHLCEVIEVIPQKKLTYSWRYAGYSGISFVTFDLYMQGNQTLLKLTHRGIESFPAENPDFALHNFGEGWGELLNNRLRKHLEEQNFQYQISVNATPEKVFESLTRKIPFWWTEMFEENQIRRRSFTVRFGSAVFKQ